MAASIKVWGFRQPIVADGAGVIVVGHTRYKAAVELGPAEVPVHVARGLTPEQAKAYSICDNQTATLSVWGDGLLVQELAALQAADFDLGLTGFAEDDLLKLLADPPAEATGDPDDVPDPPAALEIVLGPEVVPPPAAEPPRPRETGCPIGLAGVVNDTGEPGGGGKRL